MAEEKKPAKGGSIPDRVTQDPSTDSLIQLVVENNRFTEKTQDLGNIPLFKEIVSEYKTTNPNDALHKTAAMMYHFDKLYLRILAWKSGSFGIDWDKEWHHERMSWKQKQQLLASLLSDAADIFDSGQNDSGLYPSLTGYNEIENGAWCRSDQLREWARLVRMSPVEVVFPMARPELPGLLMPEKNIGNSGGAADRNGAFRGLVVREIAYFVPETMESRFSIIAKISRHLGMDISRQNVRGILLGGRT